MITNYIYIMIFIIAFFIMFYAMFAKKTIIKPSKLYALAILLIIVGINMMWDKAYLLLFNPFVFIIAVLLVYPTLLKIYIKIRNAYFSGKTYKDLDTLNRECDFEYNPSIVGYLINQQVVFKDLSADILNLYAKRIINIKKSDNSKYIIEQGEKYSEFKGKVNKGDRYILDNFLENKKNFDYYIWKDLVEEEYYNLELSIYNNGMEDKKFFITNILIVFFTTLIIKLLGYSLMVGFMVGFLLALGFTFFYFVRGESKQNKNLKLTQKGKEEMSKSLKLKRFMEEYTLLDERTVEEIQIYEKYLPFAISLGVNKKYSNTIYNVFDSEELNEILKDIDFVETFGENSLWDIE